MRRSGSEGSMRCSGGQGECDADQEYDASVLLLTTGLMHVINSRRADVP